MVCVLILTNELIFTSSLSKCHCFAYLPYEYKQRYNISMSRETFFMPLANSKSAVQPAHLRRLNCAFVRNHDGTIAIVIKCNLLRLWLVYVAKQTSLSLSPADSLIFFFLMRILLYWLIETVFITSSGETMSAPDH